MAGLRERQKADRERRILGAAAALFREHGFEAARIEDIAERAELAPGTVYNYFETKGDILVAIVSLEVEEILGIGARMIDEDAPSLEDAVARLIALYYDHSLVYLNKEMWRAAMALSIRNPGSRFGQRYAELDRRLSAQVCALVRSLQRRGMARPGLDADAVGQMIFNNLNMMFIEFVRDDAMSLDALKAAVGAQNAPLARLIAARQAA
jgi:AcrR family transcriptional regulator